MTAFVLLPNILFTRSIQMYTPCYHFYMLMICNSLFTHEAIHPAPVTPLNTFSVNEKLQIFVIQAKVPHLNRVNAGEQEKKKTC